MKKIHRFVIRLLIPILFLVGFLPTAEYLILRAIQIQNFFSFWILAAILWLIIMTEANIFIISFLQRTPAWKKMVSWFRSFLPWKPKEKINGENSAAEKFKIYLSSLGYIGLFICTTITNLGRLGDAIFATNKKRLPHGRIFLYAGCIMRVVITYGGFKLLWP